MASHGLWFRLNISFENPRENLILALLNICVRICSESLALPWSERSHLTRFTEALWMSLRVLQPWVHDDCCKCYYISHSVTVICFKFPIVIDVWAFCLFISDAVCICTQRFWIYWILPLMSILIGKLISDLDMCYQTSFQRNEHFFSNSNICAHHCFCTAYFHFWKSLLIL